METGELRWQQCAERKKRCKEEAVDVKNKKRMGKAEDVEKDKEREIGIAIGTIL